MVLAFSSHLKGTLGSLVYRISRGVTAHRITFDLTCECIKHRLLGPFRHRKIQAGSNALDFSGEGTEHTGFGEGAKYGCPMISAPDCSSESVSKDRLGSPSGKPIVPFQFAATSVVGDSAAGQAARKSESKPTTIVHEPPPLLITFSFAAFVSAV